MFLGNSQDMDSWERTFLWPKEEDGGNSGGPSSDKPDLYDMDADGFSEFRIISFVLVEGPIREKKLRSLLILKGFF